jgi:hypothetical protein
MWKERNICKLYEGNILPRSWWEWRELWEISVRIASLRVVISNRDLQNMKQGCQLHRISAASNQNISRGLQWSHFFIFLKYYYGKKLYNFQIYGSSIVKTNVASTFQFRTADILVFKESFPALTAREKKSLHFHTWYKISTKFINHSISMVPIPEILDGQTQT